MRYEIDKVDGNVFHVRHIPNKLEKLFGYTEKVLRYKNTMNTFVFGGGRVYKREDGSQLLNHDRIGEMLDKYYNKF